MLYKGKQVYFVEKTKKLVFWNNLINQRGCDASNMHDEEIIEPSEQDFSDDEQEKSYKKIMKKVKNQRKRKRENPPAMPYTNQYPPAQFSQYKKREIKVGEMNQYQMQPPYPYAPPMNYGQNMQPENPEMYTPHPFLQSLPQAQAPPFPQSMPQAQAPQFPQSMPQAPQFPQSMPPNQAPPQGQYPFAYNPPYGYPPYNNQPQ